VARLSRLFTSSRSASLKMAGEGRANGFTAVDEYAYLPGGPYSYENPPSALPWPSNVVAVAEDLSPHAWWWPYSAGWRCKSDGV
jgi:hypothetical protein